MASFASSRLATRGHRAIGAWLITAAFITAGVAAIAFVARPGAQPAPAAPAHPPLILRPYTSIITGSLPGANTVRLHSGVPATAGSLTLTASMPGMFMPPIRVMLDARAGGYIGTVILPMFGDYLAVLALRSPVGRATGNMSLHLPCLACSDRPAAAQKDATPNLHGEWPTTGTPCNGPPVVNHCTRIRENTRMARAIMTL
jgi:hypothetical protein